MEDIAHTPLLDAESTLNTSQKSFEKQSGDPEELISHVVDDLLDNDNSTDRARLREIDLIYLGASL